MAVRRGPGLETDGVDGAVDHRLADDLLDPASQRLLREIDGLAAEAPGLSQPVEACRRRSDGAPEAEPQGGREADWPGDERTVEPVVMPAETSRDSESGRRPKIVRSRIFSSARSLSGNVSRFQSA